MPGEYAIAAIVFFCYTLAVLGLRRKLESKGIRVIGPVLMLKTERGQGMLQALSKPRSIWRIFGWTGLAVALSLMIFMLSMLLVTDYISMTRTPKPSEITEPRNILLIPGINVFIPIVWGIIGIAVAMIAHELSHGIMCKLENVRVKSLGVLFALVPIGAFAEPDEDELFKGKVGMKGRMKILSAGVMGNFAVAVISLMLFFFIFIPSIQPVGDSCVVVLHVEKGSEEWDAGFSEWDPITKVDGERVTNLSQALISLRHASTMESDGKTTVAGKLRGVRIMEVLPGFPAEIHGLRKGMVITRMNDVEIRDAIDFTSFMMNTSEDESVEIYVDGRENPIPVNLTGSPYGKHGFLGVVVGSVVGGITLTEFPARPYLESLKSIGHPSIPNLLILLSLPFQQPPLGFNSFSSGIHKIYRPVGLLSSLGDRAFWIGDALFWIGWINLLACMFNSLPASPLDGGHIFRDVARIFARLVMRQERIAEDVASKSTSIITAFVFSSLFIMFAAPYIVHGML